MSNLDEVWDAIGDLRRGLIEIRALNAKPVETKPAPKFNEFMEEIYAKFPIDYANKIYREAVSNNDGLDKVISEVATLSYSILLDNPIQGE